MVNVSHNRLARRIATAVLLGGGLLGAAGPAVASASSASGFYIRGGGDGHGIGMSQYGALGMAQHGFSYREILDHYYQGISLGTTPNQTVTVLLSDGHAAFSGASRAGGKTLKPGTTYDVHPTAAGSLQLVASGARKPLGTFTAPLTISGAGGGPVNLAGLGAYRGALVFRPDGSGGVQTVNAVDLEDYVRGVVAAEMPSSWPTAALEAQSIAARTYVLTSGAINGNFDVYSDTRSQMYRGVSAETPSTDAAIAATRGQIVTYAGQPATTYFFASSGGHTEDIQNVWLGVTPESWLQGVPDPYDDSGGNPYYRWKLRLSLRSAGARLRGLVRGRFIGIKVTRRGVSPRVISAVVVGSRGRTNVTGPQLQQLFGLMSTYMSFTTISTKGSTKKVSRPASSGSSSASGPGSGSGSGSGGVGTGGSSPFSSIVSAPGSSSSSTTTSSSSGGAGFGAAARRAPALVPEISGSLYPAGPIRVQMLRGDRWVTVSRGRTNAAGAYSVRVAGAGEYRILAGGFAGPAVSVLGS